MEKTCLLKAGIWKHEGGRQQREGGENGPLSTMVFHLENIPAGSGMGTCGLVGPIGIYTAMQGSGNSMMWPGILLICFVLPAVLTLFFGTLCRKAGWIKEGDLKLDL